MGDISATPIGSDPLAIRLDAHLKDSPRDVWGHTEFQLLRLIKDEPTPDLTALATLPQEDRELVTAVVDGLTNFRNALRQDSKKPPRRFPSRGANSSSIRLN